MPEEELINPDLKEKTCRILAATINKMMDDAIKAYERGEMFKFRDAISSMKEYFDVFREYCLAVVLPEEEETK